MAIYGSRAAADTYHSDRGNTTWTGADAVKDQALLRASEWVDRAFRSSFPGEKTDGRASATPQVREWPRIDAYDIEGDLVPSDTTPTEVENATYEAALREIVTPGSLSPDYDPSGQVRREKVDMIEVEYTAGHGPDSVRPLFPIIAGILAPILTRNTGSYLVGRSIRI
jgi:hypothetical protein